MKNIIGKKWYFFIFSGLIIIPGIVSLFLWGLRSSIDFTGGTLIEFKVQNRKIKINNEDIKKEIMSAEVEVGSIQQSGENVFLVRMKPIDKDKNQQIQKRLTEKYGQVDQIRSETVGPTVGKETTAKALNSVIIASIAIVLYVAWAFRKIPKPYSSLKFGICAVVALIHDILVVVGLFSILGHFFKVEVDSLFITALLTVMGFSVHDTIVVFDRIRENLNKMAGEPFDMVVNESIVQTLVRSLSTSLTVIFTLIALLLFGGETIKWFIVALLIGITSGTYSSVFNAAPLLVLWEERGKLLNPKKIKLRV